jgi:hypothetical protein
MRQIKLTLEETQIADAIAKRRFNQNRLANRPISTQGAGSPESYDAIGMRGELAFCKLYNCYPDLSFLERDLSLDKGDCYIKDYGWVDVKTSERPDANLVISKNKIAKPGAFFALMTGVDREFIFHGLIEQNSALQPERLKQLRHGKQPAYFVLRSELFFPFV